MPSTATHAEARVAVAAALVAAVLFGTTGTAASFAPVSAGAAGIGAARLVIGGFGLLAVLPLLGGHRGVVLGLWRTRLGATAGAFTAAYQVAFFGGVSLAGVAVGTLLTIGAAPVIVGLLSWATLGEPPNRSWWASTLVCIAGLTLLTLDGSTQPDVSFPGILLALLAAVLYASYTVAAKGLIRAGATSPEAMTVAFGLGGVLLLPVLLASGPGWIATPNGLAVALWLGIGATLVAYVLFGRSLRVLPAGHVVTLVLLEPLVATLLGVGLLGERFGAGEWLGAGLIAAGITLQGFVSTRTGRDPTQE